MHHALTQCPLLTELQVVGNVSGYIEVYG